VERLNAAMADDDCFDEPAEHALRRYLEENDGAHFHEYELVSSPPDEITPGDLVAVTFLSMEIRRRTSSGITPCQAQQIEASRSRITSLLTQIPTTRELHTLSEVDYDRWMGAGSPADLLWHHLRNDVGLRSVATHKLLARKRPHLLPIRDSATNRALTKHTPWWRPWWLALSTSPSTIERLRTLREKAGSPELSLLRVADIVIWMRFKAKLA
jgi:Family of unknown function (DUF6308)